VATLNTKENIMRKINWDEAPDWATHAVYRKITQEIIYFDCERYKREDNGFEDHYYYDFALLTFTELLLGAEERPKKDGKLYAEDFGAIPMSEYEPLDFDAKEWNGEGLPPVGTVCEYYCDSGTWYIVDILGYRKNNVFLLIGGNEALATFELSVWSDRLRVIDKRTEKEKAIDEMKECVESGYFINRSCVYNAMKELYDAGYRKESNNE